MKSTLAALNFVLLRVSKRWDYSQALARPALASVQLWQLPALSMSNHFWRHHDLELAVCSVFLVAGIRFCPHWSDCIPYFGEGNDTCQGVSGNKLLLPKCKPVQGAEGTALLPGTPQVQSMCPVSNVPVSQKYLPGSYVRSLTSVACWQLVTFTKATNEGKVNLKVKPTDL